MTAGEQCRLKRRAEAHPTITPCHCFRFHTAWRQYCRVGFSPPKPRCRLKTQMAAQQCRAAINVAIPTQNGTDNRKCRLKGLQTALCSDGRAYFAACSPSLAKYLA
ncbi:hypothetical protein [Neisseria bergeri]|uniref:hypothetical protein n=1 Tax=Neisseria bergeri TaxID=1906581 RepID=UPI0027E021F5|nr:hypothetical protein [Neisseria bergeri]